MSNVPLNQSKQKKKKQRKRKGKKDLDFKNITNIKDSFIIDKNDKGDVQSLIKPLMTQNKQDDTNESQVSSQGKTNPSDRKNKSRKRPDRYYGRFSCRICRRTWDSAFVFTRAGTKKVLYKQRCKKCDHKDAWMFPYHLELLRCSQCQSDVCECLCEECDKLKHLRYLQSGSNREDRIVDKSFEYCHCYKRRNIQFGGNVDKKKPHLAQFCQKCLSGNLCTVPRSELEEHGDNEP